VTSIGPLPNDTDALSFGPDLTETKDTLTKALEWRFPVLVGLFLLALVVVAVAMRSKA
jgi:hypothetical protein